MSEAEVTPDTPLVTEEALHPLPALFIHCKTVYEAMEQDAVEQVDNPMKLWSGFITKFFAKLNLSIPYVSKVMTALQEMDCVRQVRRGGGSAPSEWLLVQPPSRELWVLVNAGRPSQRPQDQMLRDLHQRLTKCEEALGLV